MNVRRRLLNARRLLLMLLSPDPAKRAAWEVLVGPVDWDRAERCEPQADEPIVNPDAEYNPHGLPNMTKPDMLLTAEAGLLPELTGGHDALAGLKQSLGESEEGKAADDRRSRVDRRHGSLRDGFSRAAFTCFAIAVAKPQGNAFPMISHALSI